MYKAVIADDEEKLCKLIQLLVNWEDKGIEIAGIAHDGIEALELVKKHKPDMILTDVRMPGLNGLDLIQKIKEETPDISCVIISGYQEFDYVKRALQFGVEDYLLKPVKKEDINRVVDGIIRKKELLSQEKREMEKMQEASDAHKYKMRQLFVEALVKGDIRNRLSDRKALETEYYCDFSGERFAMFGIKLHLQNNWPQRSDELNFITNWKNQIEAAWKEESNTELYCAVVDGILYGFVNLYSEEYGEIRQAIRRIVGHIMRNNGHMQNLNYTIGFSKVHSKLSTFSEMGNQVRTALYSRFVPGKTDRLIVFNKSQKGQDIYSFITVPTQNRILADIEKNKFEDVEKLAVTIRNQILDRETENGQMVLDVWIEFLKLILLGCKNLIEQEERKELERSYLFQLENCCTEQELFARLTMLLRRVEQVVTQRTEERAVHPAKMAKEYVEQKYAEDCSLAKVSRLVGLNAAYFSVLFKKEEGIGFNEYVTEVRMQNAKEMLMDRETKVVEIAQSTGYSDEKYFSRAFKKHVGLTPSEYRKLYC
jgi:two-component system response regulator YesN